MFRSPSQFIRCCIIASAAWVVGMFPLHAKDKEVPEVPMEIEVPMGSKVCFHAFAEGVQIYTWNGTNWGASVPEAVLYDKKGKVVAIHYGGPTWEDKHGLVVGMVIAPRITVDPDAIPWLLLGAAHNEGHGVLAKTDFIQRVNTVGGKAPAAAGDFVGQVVCIPYAADYYFFRSKE